MITTRLVTVAAASLLMTKLLFAREALEASVSRAVSTEALA